MRKADPSDTGGIRRVLERTMDYKYEEVVRSIEKNLVRHNFEWDRELFLAWLILFLRERFVEETAWYRGAMKQGETQGASIALRDLKRNGLLKHQLPVFMEQRDWEIPYYSFLEVSPGHQERRRAYEEIVAAALLLITDNIVAEVRRTIAVSGSWYSPEAFEGIKKILSDSFVRRARPWVNDAVMRAFLNAQATAFLESGVTELAVLAEMRTAGDEKVCPVCLELEAQGMLKPVLEWLRILPVHPYCRCILVYARGAEK